MNYESGKQVVCPIAGKTIDYYECCDICLVAEGTSPEDEVPVWMNFTPEMAKRCMECPNHME